MIRRPATVGTSRPTTVGVFPIGDPKDNHNQPVIPNCVDDPIVAYANPVEVVYPTKFLTPCGRGSNRSASIPAAMRS